MNIDATRVDQMQADLATLTAQNASMQRDIDEIKIDLKKALRDNAQRIAALEVGAATCRQQWAGHAERHRSENRAITVISTIISSAVAAAIGAVSWFRGRP